MTKKIKQKNQLLMLLLAAALIVLPLGQAAAMSAYLTAAAAAERLYSELNESLKDEMLATRKSGRATQIHNKVMQAAKAFQEHQNRLAEERDRLMVNPKDNATLIAEIDEAQARLRQAQQKIREMVKMVSQSDQVTLNAAKKDGFLAKRAVEVANAIGNARQTIDGTYLALGDTGNESPGSVTIDGIDVTPAGGIVFYMKDYVAGKGVVDVELEVGQTYRVSKLPITIRAAIQNNHKTRLTRMLDEPRENSEIQFTAIENVSKGHKFEYSGKPGKSVWVANEAYRWNVSDGRGRNKVRALKQRGSDLTVAEETGDVVEIYTEGAVAQHMRFVVDATGGWTRTSTLSGGVRQVQVPTKPEKARAEIEISLFPN